jgi:Mg-chelatase subunit ChlD
MPEETSLTKKFNPTIGKVGLAAQRKQALAEAASTDITKFPNKLGILFDDSGSMSHQMDLAKEATESFLQSCNKNDTAVALYGFSPQRRYKLTNDMISLALLAKEFHADQGTPLYTTLEEMLEKESMTRGVIFSDGEPTDHANKDVENMDVIDRFVNRKIPIDTIFLGYETANGAKVLKEIADRTGGIFMHFTSGSNFAKALKYLAPGFRGMLMNQEIVDKLQRGEKI